MSSRSRDYANAKPDADPEKVFDKLRETWKSDIVEEKNIETGGIKGLQFRRETKQGAKRVTIHYRAYFHKGRLYQAFINVPESAKDKVDVKKFFDSLQFPNDKKDN